MNDPFEKIVADPSFDRPYFTLTELCSDHARCFLQYEKFRKIKASCYSAAKELAAGKPVTDTYLERAIVEAHGEAVLEEGKALWHRLQALEIQMRSYSALLDHFSNEVQITGDSVIRPLKGTYN